MLFRTKILWALHKCINYSMTTSWRCVSQSISKLSNFSHDLSLDGYEKKKLENQINEMFWNRKGDTNDQDKVENCS